MKELEELNKQIKEVLDKYNPCNIKDGKCTRGYKVNDGLCCQGVCSGNGKACNNLTTSGCKDKPIGCHLWLCHDSIDKFKSPEKESLCQEIYNLYCLAIDRGLLWVSPLGTIKNKDDFGNMRSGGCGNWGVVVFYFKQFAQLAKD
jgi:hypothetical protein